MDKIVRFSINTLSRVKINAPFIFLNDSQISSDTFNLYLEIQAYALYKKETIKKVNPDFIDLPIISLKMIMAFLEEKEDKEIIDMVTYLQHVCHYLIEIK